MNYRKPVKVEKIMEEKIRSPNGLIVCPILRTGTVIRNVSEVPSSPPYVYGHLIYRDRGIRYEGG